MWKQIYELLYIWRWGQGFRGSPEYWLQDGAMVVAVLQVSAFQLMWDTFCLVYWLFYVANLT